jgi:Ran GTPase-activating protein (RanGAP) involved in mRNA processing and transport
MAEKFVDESKLMNRVSDLILESKRMLPPIKGYENQPIVTLEKSVKPLISIVPDVEQMVWTVKQNCENPQDNLTSDESGSIMLYTLEWEPVELSFYFILNSTLRSENRQKLKPWFLYLRLIIYALSKLPSIPSQTIYRAVKTNLSKIIFKEKTFIWWAFSSCTSTIEVIKHFLGQNGPRTIINIESDSAKDISRHSFYQTENEILLFPARQFRIVSSIDIGNQLQIFQIKEIQPPFPLIHIPETDSTIYSTSIYCPYQNQRLEDFIGKCEHHSKIDLSFQKLTDEDMNIVVKEAIIKKQCKELGLINTNITPTCMSIIAKALNGNNTLERLFLSSNNVGDIGVQFLAKTLSLNNSSLTHLFLASVGITDEGVKYLAQMLKTNSKLCSLTLERNNIGDKGIEILANTLIHYNNTLEHIFLESNKLVSDSSVDSLVEMLKQNLSLSSLSISHCSLSEEGKERIRRIFYTKKDFLLWS